MKKLKHLFTALLLLCGVGTATAHDFEVDGIYYNITDDTNKTVEVTYRGTSYSQYDDEYTGSVVIPESVAYNGTTYNVTSIGDYAFSFCTGLTSVVIGNSVTSIGYAAFNGCTGLTSVVIGNSVTRIRNYAFSDCTGLTSVVIGNSVTSIGDWTFYRCTGLTSVVIGNSVTSIGEGAFSECSGLTNITIPNSVTSIGGSAFAVCYGLTNITIPNSVTSIGEGAFSSCTGLTSITIPNSVTSIGGYAFSFCTGLTSIEIGNSVTSIGNSAFSGCTGLKEVHISNLAAWCGIDFSADYSNPLFYACNLYLNGELVTDLVIPNSVTSIGEGAFSSCTGLTSITIPNSVTSIGGYAFSFCTGLTSIEIGNSVTSIGNSAFSGCTGLKEVHISNLAAWCGIDFSADYSNPLFYACNLYLNGELVTDLVIPNSVTSIGSYAFSGCSGLTSIVIPNSVTSIGENAFNGCKELTSIVVDDYNTKYDSRENCNAIIETETNTLILGCKNSVIPNSVTSIGDYAFNGCTGLTSITIPNSVTSIGSSAFNGCTGLTSITIPNSVTSIGSSAFNGCTGLTSVVIGNSVTSIGRYAFYECTGLKTVYNFSNLTFSKGSEGSGYVAYYATKVINAPNAAIDGDFIWCNLNGANTLACYLGEVAELTLPADFNGENYVIGNDAFNGCTGLTSITIPSSVTSIGERAFYDCTGLKEVHISDLAAWCNIAFASADANPLYYAGNLYLNGKLLTDISIPTEVEKVKDYTFYNCIDLASIEIPNSVKSIGNQAFYGCTGLKTVYNFSNLTFYKGSGYNGYVAYYATKVYNVPNGFIDGDFIWYENEDGMTLAGYLGNATELTLPAGYNGENYAIGAAAFQNYTGLATELIIHNNITGIGASAFKGCNNIEKLYIGSSVESIGDKAFAGCEKITEIKVALEKPIRGSADIFADAVYDNATLYIPNGTEQLYQKREPWNMFFYIVEIDFTGIEDVEAERVKDVYYDLSGRVVENPANGIYIIDGKKVLIK